MDVEREEEEEEEEEKEEVGEIRKFTLENKGRVRVSAV